ncbi:MAG: glycosyltransferase [Acidobacteria bacterium]|nr:glycosyltransferase [Acidobacteriota bacterium]MCI0626711.1 glycosyltransferase [Acidobacteriota bacterium]MCI0723291.1 glycosyltransferase [Acidobacteriota bacterium]
MKPLVSIVTPSFNQGQFIEETIQSVLAQDYPNIEYLVVDGGSTDNTLEILAKYEDRLKWISEPDSGQSHAINKGFRMARGEIVAWLNSDDTFLPGAVSKAAQHLTDNPEIMMVYGEGYLMDLNSQITGRFPATEPFNLWRLINYGDYILQQTVFMRKKIFDVIPMVDESLHYGMDWDLFIRIGKRFKVDYLPEYLGMLREYPEAKSFAGGVKRLAELTSIMRRHGNRRYPPAFFNYCWHPYQDAFLEKLRHAVPWLRWTWLENGSESLRKVVTYLIFKQVTRMGQPSPFLDGWVADCSYFLFTDVGDKKMVRVVGSTQEVPGRALPMKIKLSLNGRVMEQRKVRRESEFVMTCPIAPQSNGEPLEVVLKTNRHFVPARFGAKDNRRLAFQLKEIGLV